ncbi:MAG TPA: glycosyltransferase family 39 protein [Caldilineaceae bacterium]|nr:glycosyltransferase family 39 protein [Caldilineaceae bacterium]
MDQVQPQPRPAWPDWPRLVLLALALIAFLRLTWALDAKNLWWDESLSLQRAESPWPALIVGRLVLFDGLTELTTYDQHPFFFFLLQGILLRLAGNSEYVLRLPSVMAATLLVPAVWVWGRLFTRRGVFAPGAALWAALLAAAHPFFLWYGQEARPYALWALMALISTYALARAVERGGEHGGGWWLGYALSAPLFLASHYYAVFLLPVHALLLAHWLWRRNRQAALLAALLILGAGAAVGAYAYWLILVRQGGGANFPEVDWEILFPDLLNAFSLGLSVDITKVWPLDLLCGALALAGAIWSVRSRDVIAAGGWLAPALVLGPVAALLIATTVYPAYMNARHMSLIGGGMILLLGSGLALTGRRQQWVAGALALILLAGMGYSTVNYFTQEEYGKDDFTGLGSYLDDRLAPGDLILLKSPFAERIFRYYLPIAAVDAARAQGAPIAHYGVPALRLEWGERERQVAELVNQYRRIWYIVSNTHPYMDLEGRLDRWMDEHLFRVQETSFFSHSSLRASLYLPEVPVYNEQPPPPAQPVDAAFGDLIGLAGYEVGRAYTPALGLPVTLYWQIFSPTQDRYKYILKLVEMDPGGSGQPVRELAVTEREPYDGAIPTLYWAPGQTIVEYSELPPTPWPRPATPEEAARYRLLLQVYRADTLEKLPVTRAEGLEIAPDGQSLLLPTLPETFTGR